LFQSAVIESTVDVLTDCPAVSRKRKPSTEFGASRLMAAGGRGRVVLSPTRRVLCRGAVKSPPIKSSSG
jgi:hypothetical protein